MKYPVTPAGIEPVTFQFVAQHLNYCATMIPKVVGLIYVANTREVMQCVIWLRKSEPNFGKAPQLPASHDVI